MWLLLSDYYVIIRLCENGTVRCLVEVTTFFEINCSRRFFVNMLMWYCAIMRNCWESVPRTLRAIALNETRDKYDSDEYCSTFLVIRHHSSTFLNFLHHSSSFLNIPQQVDVKISNGENNDLLNAFVQESSREAISLIQENRKLRAQWVSYT